MSDDRTWLIGVAVITLGVCAAMPYYQQRQQQQQLRRQAVAETPATVANSPAEIPLRMGGEDLQRWLAPLAERDELEAQTRLAARWPSDAPAQFTAPPRLTPMFPSGIADPHGNQEQPASSPPRTDGRGAISTELSTALPGGRVIRGGSNPAWPDTAGRPADADFFYHVVKDGESLESIARHLLGDAHRAGEIYEANRDVLSRPDIVPLKTRLRIPLLSTAPSPPRTQPLTPIRRTN